MQYFDTGGTPGQGCAGLLFLGVVLFGDAHIAGQQCTCSFLSALQNSFDVLEGGGNRNGRNVDCRKLSSFTNFPKLCKRVGLWRGRGEILSCRTQEEERDSRRERERERE